MLEGMAEVAPAFLNPFTELQKQIECIRVDGACNEGPSREVQFFLTLWHVNKEYSATLVTARSSGCSYLNHVELQNGCLALRHVNLFIPSMLCGSNIDSETGKIHRERVVSNIEQATEVYINGVNGSRCGETNIHLFKGADSSAYPDLHLHLLLYFKGTKAQKERLRQAHREVYDHIERIWTIRNNHMVKNLPVQYVIFFSVLL